MTWIEDLKHNVQQINQLEQQRRKVYGEATKQPKKTLRKSYFSRPKILTDWEYQKKKKSMNTNRLSRDVHVKQFSNSNVDYNKPWNKLKYEHKINRIIHYVKTQNLDRDTRKQLIHLTKSRKIKVEYENGEITKIVNYPQENQ